MKHNRNGDVIEAFLKKFINEFKLNLGSIDPAQDFLAKHFYSSSESFDRSLHDNLGTIVTLTGDVFVTSFDLVLVDHSHGLLGGDAKKQSREEIEDFSAAELRIRDHLHRLAHRLPVIWTEIGVSYFIPALTMPLAACVKFSQLSKLEKLKVALQTKRVFVNGETFLDYGGDGKQMPDPDFWSALFKFDPDHVCTDSEISEIDFADGASLAFWLERCIERDGGEARFVDRLDLDALVAEDSKNLERWIRSLALEWGMDRNAELFERRRYGAILEKAAD